MPHSRIIAPDLRRFGRMQAMPPCLEVYSLDSDHAPQLSDPDGLVAALLVVEYARAL